MFVSGVQTQIQIQKNFLKNKSTKEFSAVRIVEESQDCYGTAIFKTRNGTLEWNAHWNGTLEWNAHWNGTLEWNAGMERWNGTLE